MHDKIIINLTAAYRLAFSVHFFLSFYVAPANQVFIGQSRGQPVSIIIVYKHSTLSGSDSGLEECNSTTAEVSSCCNKAKNERLKAVIKIIVITFRLSTAPARYFYLQEEPHYKPQKCRGPRKVPTEKSICHMLSFLVQRCFFFSSSVTVNYSLPRSLF